MGPCLEEASLLEALAALRCSCCTRTALRGGFQSLPDGPLPHHLLPAKEADGLSHSSSTMLPVQQHGAGLDGRECTVSCSERAGRFWDPWLELAAGLQQETSERTPSCRVHWLQGACMPGMLLHTAAV